MAWFAKAAANGNADAQWKLGLGYLKGIGVQQDEGKAAEWFKTAANQGHIRAQSALSELYFNGRGVPRDYVRAYTWASIAPGLAGKNNDRIKIIGSRMTAVQIEDAHRRISIWRERHTPETAEAIVSRPTNPRVDASGTRGAATCGQSSETPASADLLQEPIQPSTLGGASGADAASHATPTSAAASPAGPVQEDTKITSSRSDPATLPEPAHQAQEQEQSTPADHSRQSVTPTASSEQNAAATIPQPAKAPAQPKDEPEPAKPSTPDTKITSSQNGSATRPQAATQADPLVRQQEQPQAIPGNQSSQTETPRNRTPQPLSSSLLRRLPSPRTSRNRLSHQPRVAGLFSVSNSSLAAPMVAPPLNAADVAGTVDRAKQQLSPDEYMIGEQDQLGIVIWKEPELSSTVVVRPDGKITVPLINELRVVGLTPIPVAEPVGGKVAAIR